MIFETKKDAKDNIIGFGLKDILGESKESISLLSEKDIELLKKYNDGLKDLGENEDVAGYVTDFLNDNMEDLSDTTKDLIKNSEGSEIAINKDSAALTAYSTKAKAAAVATKLLNAAINALAVAVISWMVSEVVKSFDEMIQTEEELESSVDDLMKKYQDADNKAKSYKDSVEELIPIYQELSKGVDGLGRNVSLTEDEFNQYNITVNKIADMFPELIDGFTDENNVILTLGGNVEKLRDLYKEAQKEAYGLLITTGKDESGNDIIKQFQNHANPYAEKSYYANKIQRFSEVEQLDLLKQFANMSVEEYKEAFSEYNKNGGINTAKTYLMDTLDALNSSYKYDKNGKLYFDETDFNRARQEAEALIQQLETGFNTDLMKFKTVANAWLNLNPDVLAGNISSEVQTALSLYINNMDFEDAIKYTSNEAVGAYINSIIDAIKNNDAAQKIFVTLFTLRDQELSIPEFEAQVAEYINKLADILPNTDPITLRASLGFDDDSLVTNYNAAMKKAAEKFGDYKVVGGNNRVLDYDLYNEFAKENSINTQDEIAFWNQCIDESETREEAMEKYLNTSVPSSGTFSKFTDEQSKEIDDFQSKINSLGNTLKALSNGEDIDMADLIQEFPELAGHVDDLDTAIIELANSSLVTLKEKLGDAIPPEVIEALKSLTEQVTGAAPKLSEAYSGIHNTYDILQHIKAEFDETTGLDKFTDSTLQSIAGINEHMNSMVAAWHANGITSQELFDALQDQYQTDLENYGNALIKKYEDSEKFYNSVGMMSADVINSFKDDYRIDLQNCHTYNEAKQAIEMETLGKVANVWGKYYDIQTKQLTSQAKAMKAVWDALPEGDARTSVYNNSTVYQELVDSIAMMEEYQKDVEALNQLIYKGTEVNFAGVSAKLKDAADSAKSEYDDLFDFFERRLEIINQSLEKLDASLEEVNGSMSKNILIAGKIGIVQEEIKNYSSALAMYEQKANAELSKLSSDLQDKIKNGAVSITKLIGENGEEVNKTLEEYKKWADKVNDCNQQLITLKETLRDLALEKFNNIAQDYSDQFDILGSSNDIIEKQIALFEEAGQIVGRAFYESQIEVAQKQKVILEKERAALLNELSSSISSGLIQKGTDEWLEMSKKIQEVDSNILDVDQSVERLQNSLLELNDKVFDRLQNAFSDISSQLSNIVGIIGDIDVSDEKGVWSEEGLTKLGVYAEQYELARYNIEKYQEQLDALNDAYSKELYSTTEYIDKLSDLSQKQWDAANSAEDAKKSMIELNKARVELIKQGIQKQIEAYKELIDKQKQALDQEKSIRDYEKEIAEKSKNINKLQNQLNLLANDDSAAANAKRVKLQQELNDAMEDLEETQYNHSIEAQKEAIDKQMEDFQDARDKEIEELEEYLKDTNLVFKDSLEVVKLNTDVIANQITEIAKKHGVQISEAITNSWKSGEGAIASYGAALTSGTSNFIQQIQTIELYLTALQDEADFTADKLVDMLSAKSDNLLNEFNAARDSENELITATNLLNDALIKTLEGGYDVSGIIGSLKSVSDQVKKTKDDLDGLDKDKDNDNSSSTTPVATTNTIVTTEEGSNASVKDYVTEAQMKREKEQQLSALKSQFKYPQYFNPYTGEYTDKYNQLDIGARRGDPYANQLNEQINRAIREYNEKRNEILTKYAGYATGVHNLMKSQFAWTQEDGSELILSPTRNAMFTKLNKGDTVLTKNQTDNLFKLSKINPDDVFGKFKFNGSVPKVEAPVLTIGNVLTVNGNIDDTNVEKMKAVAASAIDKAFKKFSSEIIKR